MFFQRNMADLAAVYSSKATTARKYTNDLLHGMFSLTEMSEMTVTEQVGSKRYLHPTTLIGLIGKWHVCASYTTKTKVFL